MTSFLNCIDRCVGTLTEQYMHDFATKVRTQHVVNSLLSFVILVKKLL